VYGEMSNLRAKARALRDDADGLRSRASALVAQAEALSSSSKAVEGVRARVRESGAELGKKAQLLDDAAAALEAHAKAVDTVKAQIAEAERIARDLWNQASNLVANVVDTVKDVASTAVNGFMNVLGAAMSGNPDQIQVSVFMAGGREVSSSQVSSAQSFIAQVPAPPESGSKDWIDVRSAASRNGIG
jgi:chromosome segregation ATPase